MLCPLIFSQIASFTAAAKNQRNVWLMVLVGALNGIAFLFKQVAIVNWFFLAALYPICASREKRWRDTVSFFAWSAMGLLIVIGLVVLYFWRRGGLDEFVDNVSLTTWSTSEALVYRRGLNIAGARLRRSHERRASCGRLPLQDWSLFSHPIEPSGHSLWQVGLSRL
jgi:hypothetical protein